MAYYRAHGKDSSSDNGYWEVIVKAPRRRNAIGLVNLHLLAQGRQDLVDSLSLEHITSNDILHSTVEARYEYLPPIR